MKRLLKRILCKHRYRLSSVGKLSDRKLYFFECWGCKKLKVVETYPHRQMNDKITHKEYLENLKVKDPITYSEMTSDPTGA